MKDAAEQLDALTERIHRACLTVSTFPKAGPRGFFTTWPLYKLDWYDSEEEGENRLAATVALRFIQAPTFTATPREIDDALPALELLNDERISRRARRVIRHRAFQLWYGTHVLAGERFEHWRGGWRRIGQLNGVSHKTARICHNDAMRCAFESELRRRNRNAA